MKKWWWTAVYLSFAGIFLFSTWQFRWMHWISQQPLDPFSLTGWIVSFAAAAGLLFYKWRCEKREDEKKNTKEKEE
ncbi:hypothetical protein MUN89_05305 [Halobacillus salinarum]|uniref:Uncharacterized protein n=1 Tax=Halobacillus salinarum TaxID=2932257 RepID=A0ABY4EN04_9BACI|nr:hypothetical protein [Halobacillus salinarum]UOQ45365.1 hypothetical protein MUN89_05305 [Halobacillus salinarum]